MKHKYTCIMGTYNPRKEWITRAIMSAEGLFDEIIIVDDGSAEKFEINVLNTPKWKLIRHETNKGFYEAKNTAIKASTGDIIAILDDDDWFEKDGVIKLKEFIEENDSDIWHFHLKLAGTEKSLYGVNTSPMKLVLSNPIPGVSWFKKKVWEDLEGFQYPKAEDWDFWLRAYLNGKRFKYFPELVYNFNQRAGSVSSGWTGEVFKQMRKEILARSGIHLEI